MQTQNWFPRVPRVPRVWGMFFEVYSCEVTVFTDTLVTSILTAQGLTDTDWHSLERLCTPFEEIVVENVLNLMKMICNGMVIAGGNM